MQTYVVLYWFPMTYPVYQSYIFNLDDDGQRTMTSMNDPTWLKHDVATTADCTQWMYFSASTIFQEAIGNKCPLKWKQQSTAP